MESLTVIHEDIEEQMPEECSDRVQKLKDDLAAALARIEEYEDKFMNIENNENEVKELISLCQLKNNEIFALERKVNDLLLKNEEKDKQIIMMLSMNTDFKQLVESSDKGVQTDFVTSEDIEGRLAQTEIKNVKLKEMLISQIEEIQKLKSAEASRALPQFTKKRLEPKAKSGGYYPLFLRKPKDN